MPKTLDEQIAELETERANLFKQKEPIDARLIETHNLLEALKTKRDTAKIKRGEFKFPDYKMIMDRSEESMPLYRERERQLQKLGLRGEGYIPDTMQTAIKVTLYREHNKKNKNRNLRAYVGLVKLLPYMKPMTENNHRTQYKGKKYVSLFEHTLSQYGSWFLLLTGNENDVVELHNSYSEKKKFKNLKEAFNYCAIHHYYE